MIITLAPKTGAIFLSFFSGGDFLTNSDFEKDTLYIPSGLKVKPEIFDGFGKEELFKSIVSILITGAVDIVFYLITKNVAVTIVFVLAAIAGSVMAYTKDKTNLSVADQISNMVRFSKMQKFYPYMYLDEWG